MTTTDISAPPVIAMNSDNRVNLYDEEGDLLGRWSPEEALTALATLRDNEEQLREHVERERVRRQMRSAAEVIANTGTTRNISFGVEGDGLVVEVTDDYLRQVADRCGLRVDEQPHPSPHLGNAGWTRRFVYYGDGVTFARDVVPPPEPAS